MASRIISVDPFDIVAFGGTGDLVRRKLLPALYHRDRDGQIEGPPRIVGVARSSLTATGYRDFARQALMDHVPADERDDATLERFLARLDYVRAEAAGEEGWSDLAAILGDAPGRIRVYYLATSPDLFGEICRRLRRDGTGAFVGAQRADRSFDWLGVTIVEPEPDAVRALAREVGAEVIVAQTSPYFQVLPALTDEFDVGLGER